MSTTALVVFLVWLGGLVLAFAYQPIFALFSYLWIFYNDPQSSWWGADLPALRYSLAAAIVALIAASRTPRPADASWWSSGASKLLSAFLVWLCVQTLWVQYFDVHVEGVVLCLKYVILSYVIFRLTFSELNIELFVWAHIGGCFLMGLRAHAANVVGRLETLTAPGVDDSNILAAHLITGLVLAGFMFVGSKGYRRWLAFVTLPFILNGIILTQSRGGFLALLGAAAAAWYLAPRGYRGLISVSAVLGALLLLILSNQGFRERVATIGGQTGTETRMLILAPEFRMFKDHPLGAGYRANALLSPRYMPPELLSNAGIRSAHNTFMAVLVDQGIPGVALLAGLWIWTLATLVQLKRMDARGLPLRLGMLRAGVGTALAGCFIAGVFLNMLTCEVQIWLLAVLSSLNARCRAALAKESPADGCPPPGTRLHGRSLPVGGRP